MTGVAVSQESETLRRTVGRRPLIGNFGWIWIATALLFAASALIAPGTVRLGSLMAMLPFKVRPFCIDSVVPALLMFKFANGLFVKRVSNEPLVLTLTVPEFTTLPFCVAASLKSGGCT